MKRLLLLVAFITTFGASYGNNKVILKLKVECDTEAEFSETLKTIKSRLGYAYPNALVSQNSRKKLIKVLLEDSLNTIWTKHLLTSNGTFEVKECYDLREIRQNLDSFKLKYTSIDSFQSALKLLKYPVDIYEKPIMETATISYVRTRDTSIINKLFLSKEATEYLPLGTSTCWGKTMSTLNGKFNNLHLINDSSQKITNEMIQEILIEENVLNQFDIVLQLKARYWETLKEITTRNTGKYLAMTLGDKALSVPIVLGGIESGRLTISGSRSFREAKINAALIRAPKLKSKVVLM